MFAQPEKLAQATARLRELADEAGREPLEVVAFTAFDPLSPETAAERVAELRDAGATRLIAGTRYEDADGFRRQVDFLREHVLGQ